MAATVEQRAAGRTFVVLTSGGDSPGMNAALRGIVRVTLNYGGRILIIRDGYEGLVQGRIALGTWASVAGILDRGGTILGSSRSDSFRTVEGRRIAARRLLEWNVDTLFVIGGDGSLTGATLLSNEWSSHQEELIKAGQLAAGAGGSAQHLHVVGLVGSIDNDLAGSDLTIGCDTALHRICEAIDTITSTADSHQRHFIIEVMGRNCGWLALMAALATGSDWVFIPERPAQASWRRDIVGHLLSGSRRFSMVIVAEGAQDETGQHISCEDVRAALAAGGLDSRITVLGHIQRGGAPSAIDRVLSSILGAKAVESALDATAAAGSRPAPVVLGVKGLAVVELPLVETIASTRAIPELLAKKDWPAVCRARSSHFADYFELLKVFTLPGPTLVPGEDLNDNQNDDAQPARRINVALLHCGAVSPGMNAVVRGLVRLGANKGHRVFGVTGGFKGLINGQVRRLRWLDVRQWVTESGARLKTRRDGSFTISDCMKICQVVEAHRIDAVVMIGGWDGYLALHELHSKAKDYPSLARLMLYSVPATISNGLPCTAQTIGADTALNVMATAISFIKSSAASSRRVYVVEVMGRGCGFLALASSLATGAEQCILPEIPISLSTLSELSEGLKTTFRDFNHDMAIVITSERPDPHKVLTPQFIADLLLREAGGLYGSVRFSKLGHVQQGSPPSPHDRILALSFAAAVLDHIEATFDPQSSRPTRVCAGVRETGDIYFTQLDEMIYEMDVTNRRPKHQWWFDRLHPYALVLSQPGPLAELRAKSRSLRSSL